MYDTHTLNKGNQHQRAYRETAYLNQMAFSLHHQSPKALTSRTVKVRMTFHLSSQTVTEVLQDLNSSTSFFSSHLQRHHFQDGILLKMHTNVQDKQDEYTKQSTFSFLLSLHLQLGYCYRHYVYYEGQCVNSHCHIGWHQIKQKNLLHAQVFYASNLKRFTRVAKGKPGSDSDTVSPLIHCPR